MDVDSNPVFMNQLMEAWCHSPGQQIVLSRSRAVQERYGIRG